MSDSVRPCRQQPTRLPHLWDSPGKNTGVGCHFLRQCMQVRSETEVTQSCPTLSDLMDCSLPGSFVHWIFQARVLEWGAITFPAFPSLEVLYKCKRIHSGKRRSVAVPKCVTLWNLVTSLESSLHLLTSHLSRSDSESLLGL